MKLVPVDFMDYNRGTRTNIGAYVKEFADSEHMTVEIVGYPHKTACSCQSAFTNYLRKNKIGHIVAISRGDKVYLVKKY